MALHKDFPASPYTVLDPGVRWFPANEALRETSMEKLMPPLVSQLRKKVKEWRDSGYVPSAIRISVDSLLRGRLTPAAQSLPELVNSGQISASGGFFARRELSPFA